MLYSPIYIARIDFVIMALAKTQTQFIAFASSPLKCIQSQSIQSSPDNFCISAIR